MSSSHRLVRRAGTVVVVVGIAVAGGGCSRVAEWVAGVPASPEEARGELAERPTFEQADQDYLELTTQMRAVFEELAPDLRWNQPGARRAGTGGCPSPFAEVDGAERAWYDPGFAEGSAPDDVWPQVRREIVDLAAQHGFTEVDVVTDEPQNRDVVIGDGQGGTVTLGDRGNTTLVLKGACHLHEDAR